MTTSLENGIQAEHISFPPEMAVSIKQRGYSRISTKCGADLIEVEQFHTTKIPAQIIGPNPQEKICTSVVTVWKNSVKLLFRNKKLSPARCEIYYDRKAV
jgi:hypothetical protein